MSSSMSTDASTSASRPMRDNSRPTSTASQASTDSSAAKSTDPPQHNHQVSMQRPQSSLRSPQLVPDDGALMPPPPFVRSSSMTSKNSLPLQAPGRLFEPLDRRAPSAPNLATSTTSEPATEVPDWLSESTERYIAPGVVADYDSVLLTHPEEVNSWSKRLGYDNREIARILQFFEHVSQLKGQQYIRMILQKRTKQAPREERYEELDELDPLRLFREQRGVPPKGFVLQVPAEGARPTFNDGINTGHQATPSFRRGQVQGDQILGFSKTHDPIPVGTTLTELLLDYPNHHHYWEFLDAYFQQGVTGGQFVKAMNGHPVKTILDGAGFWGRNSTNPRNHDSFVRRRMRLRRDELIAKYGVAAAHAYLNSPIKLRELGDGIQLGTNQKLYKDIERYVAQKTNDQKEQEQREVTAEEEGQRQAPGHDMHLNSQTQISPTTSSPKAARRKSPMKRSGTLKGKEKAVESSAGRSRTPGREEVQVFDTVRSAERADGLTAVSRVARNTEPMTVPTLQVCLVSSEEFPLGVVAGHSFWSSIDERDIHVQTISEIFETTKRLARYIVDHDELSAHLSGIEKAAKIKELLLYLGTAVQGKGYEGRPFDTALSVQSSPPPQTISGQLEVEVRMHLEEGPVDLHSFDNTTFLAVQELRRETTRQHIQQHRVQMQVAASAVEGIIRGERSQVQVIQMHNSFEWAADLIHTSIVGLASRGLGSVRSGLHHHDYLQTAIAFEVERRISSAYGDELPDLQLLKARRKEARAYRYVVANPTYPAPCGILLAASLREEALRNIQAIVDQAEDDLSKLQQAAEETGTVLGKRGRQAEDDSSDEVVSEGQQRAKNRKTLEERNLAHKSLPKEFVTELGEFVNSGKNKAVLWVDDPGDGITVQIVARTGIAADDSIPQPTPEPPSGPTNGHDTVDQPAVNGVKRKSSDVVPKGDGSREAKKVRTDAMERPTLVLQDDGSFEEENRPHASPSPSFTSATAVPRVGSLSSDYSNELTTAPRSVADEELEDLEKEDFYMLFGAGASDGDVDWTLGVADMLE